MKKINSMLVLTTLVIWTACEKDSEPGKKFEPMQYNGTYVGTWTNLTTGASDSASLKIEIVESSKQANLTLDFDGNYLGLNDPPPATMLGTYDDYGAKVIGTSPIFGDFNVTIDANGKIVGLMENLASGAIPKMTYTGILTSTKVDADYEVTLADGSIVNSILRLQK